MWLQEFHLTGFTFAFIHPATPALLLPEEKCCSFGSHITDDIRAPTQLLAACAEILSVPILYISHSGVMNDGVLPGLGILAWICFLNLFQCPGPLADPGSPSSVSVLTCSNPEGTNHQPLLGMVKSCQQHKHTSSSNNSCTHSSHSELFHSAGYKLLFYNCSVLADRPHYLHQVFL